jgi:hypothetical protein
MENKINGLRRQQMASERIVDRLDSVFDIRIRKALNLAESVSTRVRLTYSKPENRKTFKVLSSKTTDEMKERIVAWLDDHIRVDDLVYRLGSEEIDMDTLPRASNG